MGFAQYAQTLRCFGVELEVACLLNDPIFLVCLQTRHTR